MAHKILVMSPLHNLGATVSASLLSQAITFSSRTCTLLFTQADSLLPSYFGIQEVNDPTRSIMQVVKLIDSGAIKDQDILDYAFPLTKNLHLVNVVEKSLTQRDRIQVISHIYNRSATDCVVIDNSDDLSTSFSKSLIQDSDQIFIVVQPTVKSLARMKLWLQDPLLENYPELFIIVNEYNERIFSMRELAKYMGLPANRVCKIHYNPYIGMCCFKGALQTVLPLSKELDPRVVNLKNDIEELQQCVGSSMLVRSKKGF